MSSLHSDAIIDKNNSINIIGVTDGSIQTLGTICTSLIIDGYELELEFNVVPSNFPISVDGIIGKDFIKRYQCKLDYLTMVFTIRLKDFEVNIPITDNTPPEYYRVPSRCEIVQAFHLKSDKTTDQVIENHEIFPGVFVASTIINPKQCILRILNTNNKDVEIKRILSLPTTDLSNYDIVNNESRKRQDRIKSLSILLRPNIPEHAPESLLNLWTEFSDIFALEGDKHSVNNFYKQKLSLANFDPVYVKNYRNPHPQKEEIAKQVDYMLEQKIIEPSVSSYNFSA